MGYDEKRVIPLLVGIDLPEKSPMHWLQSVRLDGEGYGKMLASINSALDGILSRDRVMYKAPQSFSMMMSKLSAETRDAVQGATLGADNGLVYVGAPMASLPSDEAYESLRADMLQVVAVLRECVSKNVYFAGEHVRSRGNFEGAIAASERDIKLMKEAEFVMVVYPQRLASSVLMEVGYAFRCRKPIVIFTKNRNDLPFLAQGLQSASSSVRVYEYEDINSLTHQIRSNGRSLFQ